MWGVPLISEKMDWGQTILGEWGGGGTSLEVDK